MPRKRKVSTRQADTAASEVAEVAPEEIATAVEDSTEQAGEATALEAQAEETDIHESEAGIEETDPMDSNGDDAEGAAGGNEEQEAALEGEKDEKSESTQSANTFQRSFIPTLHEQFKERAKYFDARTVAMGPATLTDLSNEQLFEQIQKTESFNVKFHKESDEAPFKGYLELHFNTVEDAQECEKTMKMLQLRDDLEIKHLFPADDKRVDATSIRKHGDPNVGAHEKLPDRVLVVTGLTPEVSEAQILEKFPQCIQVYIPHSYVKKERKNYGYVEFGTKAEMEEHMGKPVTIGESTFKTFHMLVAPAPKQLLEKIDKERVSVPLQAHLHDRRIELLKRFLRLCYHYLDADYLEETMRNALKLRIKQIRNTINASNRLKANPPEKKKRIAPVIRGAVANKRGRRDTDMGRMDPRVGDLNNPTTVNLLRGISDMLHHQRGGLRRGHGGFDRRSGWNSYDGGYDDYSGGRGRGNYRGGNRRGYSGSYSGGYGGGFRGGRGRGRGGGRW